MEMNIKNHKKIIFYFKAYNDVALKCILCTIKNYFMYH